MPRYSCIFSLNFENKTFKLIIHVTSVQSSYCVKWWIHILSLVFILKCCTIEIYVLQVFFISMIYIDETDILYISSSPSSRLGLSPMSSDYSLGRASGLGGDETFVQTVFLPRRLNCYNIGFSTLCLVVGSWTNVNLQASCMESLGFLLVWSGSFVFQLCMQNGFLICKDITGKVLLSTK